MEALLTSTIRIRRLLLALAVALATGCGSPTAGDARGQLDAARAQWSRLAPANYSYVLQRGCFCGPEIHSAVRIAVSGGTVVSRTYVDTGAPVAEQWQRFFPSMDGLFDEIGTAIRNGADEVVASYDPQRGFPLNVRIDFMRNAVDDELELTTRAFDVH